MSLSLPRRGRYSRSRSSEGRTKRARYVARACGMLSLLATMLTMARWRPSRVVAPPSWCLASVSPSAVEPPWSADGYSLTRVSQASRIARSAASAREPPIRELALTG